MKLKASLAFFAVFSAAHAQGLDESILDTLNRGYMNDMETLQFTSLRCAGLYVMLSKSSGSRSELSAELDNLAGTFLNYALIAQLKMGENRDEALQFTQDAIGIIAQEYTGIAQANFSSRGTLMVNGGILDADNKICGRAARNFER